VLAVWFGTLPRAIELYQKVTSGEGPQ
jgi:hypothetical protein